jgi:cardiolipin synthase
MLMTLLHVLVIIGVCLSVVVDRQVALFGSVNLDVRSFWLDFEVTLGVYDPDFAQRLLALQDKYMEDATPVDFL